MNAKADSNFSTNWTPFLPAKAEAITRRNSTTPSAVPELGEVRTATAEQGNKLETHHFQLALGDPADAVGPKVGVPSLDAAQAAEVLIALLLPLGNQVFVSIALLDAVLIELWGGADTVTHLTIRTYSCSNQQGKAGSCQAVPPSSFPRNLIPPTPSSVASIGEHFTHSIFPQPSSPLLIAFLL